jgi:hypothetical protein
MTDTPEGMPWKTDGRFVDSRRGVIVESRTPAVAAYIVKACNAYPALMEALYSIEGWATDCGIPEADKKDAGERLAVIKSLAREALSHQHPAPTCDDFVGGRTNSEPA